MAKYGPHDLRRLSSRAGYQAKHTSDIHSRTGAQQAGSVRLESGGMLARLKRSVFGGSEVRE